MALPSEPADPTAEEGSAAIALPPIDQVAELRLARIEDLQGRTAEALARLRRASERWPDSMTTAMALWDFHRTHELPAEEIERHRSLLISRLADAGRPLPPGALRYLVENPDLDDAGMEQVLQATRQRLAARPTDWELLMATTLLERRLGRDAETRESYARMMALRPEDEAIRFDALMLDLKLERWESAREILAGEISDDSPGLFRSLYINVLAKLGRHKEIADQIDLLTSGIGDGEPDSQNAFLVRIAWDLRDAGEDEGAEAVFRRVLELDPDQVDARNAVLYLYSSDEDRARHQAEAQRQWQEQSDPTELATEGAKQMASGNVEAAFDLMRRAAAGLPDDELNWFNLGLAALRLSRWETAEAAFAEAIRLNPARAESWLHRGTALQSLDRCDEADQALMQALDRNARLGQAFYYLYQCARGRGDDESARTWLGRYNAFKE